MPKTKVIFCSLIFFLIVGCGLVFLPYNARAFQIEQISNVPAVNDFVLYETKNEIKLDPGQQATRELTLFNRTGADIAVAVSIEDFSSSAQPDQNIALSGKSAGNYSAKDFLKPEASEFILHHGEKIILPVTIDIPADAQPGGLYFAVIFSAKFNSGNNQSGNIQTISRLASLFFIRVNGNISEAGALNDFTINKDFSWGGPVNLKYDYKNSGTIYLNPYGELKITDIFGREAYTKQIMPYFVMPGAIRQQKEIFNRPTAWGLYQATLRLNRGYGNIIDQKSLYFVTLPLPYAVSIAIAALLLIWLAWQIVKSFKKK